MSCAAQTDLERLLSRALAPVEPPEHLSVRLEEHAHDDHRTSPPTSSTPGSCRRCTIRAPGCARPSPSRSAPSPPARLAVLQARAARGSRRAAADADPVDFAATRAADDRRRGRAPRAGASFRLRTARSAMLRVRSCACRPRPRPPATAIPSRETRVSCSSCGRPICPDCMTPSPVGMRCPECARRRRRSSACRAARSAAAASPVTIALIVICVDRVPGRRAASADRRRQRRCSATARCSGPPSHQATSSGS